MKLLSRILLILSCTSAAAGSSAEAFALKGVTPGLTEAELGELLPGIKCGGQSGRISGCTMSMSKAPSSPLSAIAGCNVETWSFDLLDGKVTGIYIVFVPGTSEDEIASALREKWGAPGQLRTGKYVWDNSDMSRISVRSHEETNFLSRQKFRRVVIDFSHRPTHVQLLKLRQERYQASEEERARKRASDL
jgi:hypothetical protein